MERKLFIIFNRPEIDRQINMRIYELTPEHEPRYTDEQRDQWLTNDPELSSWARESGLEAKT